MDSVIEGNYLDMFGRIFSTLCIGAAILIISFFTANYFFSRSRPPVTSEENHIVTTSTSSEQSEEEVEPSIESKSTSTPPIVELPTNTLLQVPFSPQAPFGDWSDPRQQDGCEEASVVMAWRWANDQTLTRQEALEEITGIAEWEVEKYGNARDTSAADTLSRLLREYYGYTGGRVEYNITLDQVKHELASGNILIIPFDGQILNNPNFQNGGPERHMLVVIGYDDVKKQIITNDPGTRMGEGFVYAYDNFEASFRDYETGDHEPIIGRRTAMIVVEKVSSP